MGIKWKTKKNGKGKKKIKGQKTSKTKKKFWECESRKVKRKWKIAQEETKAVKERRENRRIKRENGKEKQHTRDR